MKHKQLKKLAVVLSVCLAVTSTEFSVFAMEAPADVGDGIQPTITSEDGAYEYQLLEDGTAEITSYLGTDTDVVIPAKIDDYAVTSIGEDAFVESWETDETNPDDVYEYPIGKDIESVTIPEGVTSIGDYAFAGCYYLTSVNLPDTLESIGEGSFEECPFEEIALPEGLKTIGMYAFYGDYYLTSIEIPSTVTSIGDYAFYYGETLESVTISSRDVTIGTDVFGDCSENLVLHVYSDSTALTYATENSLTYELIEGEEPGGPDEPDVPDTSDYEYQLLDDGTAEITKYNGEGGRITIPGEIDGHTVTSIGEGAFAVSYDASSGAGEANTTLISVEIPDSVTTIGANAFDSCTSLVSVKFPKNLKSIGYMAFYYCYGLGSLDIPEGTETINSYAFYLCYYLDSVTLPASLQSIGDGAFGECGGNDVVFYVYEDSEGLTWAESSGYNYEIVTPVDTSVYTYEVLDETTKTAKITKYSGKDADVVIPEVIDGYTITEIGEYAFAGELDEEGYAAENTTLASVKIPNTVTAIDDSAFESCVKLSSVQLPRALDSIGYMAFYNCSSLTSVRIPGNTKTIGDYAFYACTALASVTLPASVESIGEGAFEGCSEGLVFYVYADSYAETWAKENNYTYELRDVVDTSEFEYRVLLDGTAEITEYKGEGGDVIVPDEIDGYLVTKIGNYAFISSFDESGYPAANETLTSVKIPDTVTSIGESAFEASTALVSVEMSANLEEIDDYAFYSCSALTSLEIPAGLADIGEYAFGGMSSLTEFNVSEDNAYYAGYDGCLYDKELTTILYAAGGKESYKFPDSLKVIGADSFEELPLTSLVIPDGVTTIEGYAFYYAQNLESVEIPESVTEIGESAFEGCSEALTLSVYRDSAGLSYAQQNNIAYNLIGIDANTKIEDCTVELELDTYTYSGSQRTPSVTVKYGDVLLVKNTDYQVSYSNNINVGTAKVTVTGAGAFTGTVEKEFTITAKDISECTITLPAESFVSDGTAIEPAVTVKDGNTELVAGTDYTVAYSNNVNVGTAKVTVTGTGNYTGTLEKEFTITEPEQKASFDDVKESDWFYKEVNYVFAHKLMTGLNDKTFGPDQPLARAQFALILYRMNGSPKVSFTQKFGDIFENDWYANAVLWANSIKVVTGYTNGNFGPADNITREQMALMMYRYAKDKGYDMGGSKDISKFTDAGNVSSYAKEAMEWAFGNGIITGKDNGTRLDPQGNAARAECAAIIMRFVQKY